MTLLALLLLAAGQVVFTPPVAFPGGPVIGDVTLADLDGDGQPDLIVQCNEFFCDPPVTVRLGDGAGGFGPEIDAEAGAAVHALADLDGDGVLDAVARVDGLPDTALGILRGDGDGTFTTIGGVDAGLAEEDAVVADFDGDGVPDLAIYDFLAQAFPINVWVALGDGTGGFSTATKVLGNVGEVMIAAADLDDDGADDLVVADRQADGSGIDLRVLISNGDGTFGERPPCADCSFPDTPTDLLLADLDGDGDVDVALGMFPTFEPSVVPVLLNDGAGGLGLAPPSLAPVGAGDLAVADVDGDRLPDLLAISTTSPGPFVSGVGSLATLLGQGDGTFTTGGVASIDGLPLALSVGDVDEDGRPDVAAATSNVGASVLLNRTNGGDEAFADLGQALGGEQGLPVQLASGTLAGGEPFAFTLALGPPSGSAFHLVGLSRIDAPFKGGVLVPAPDLVNGPLPLDADGAITLGGTWPAGVPAGVSLYLQFWMPSAVAVKGLSASTAVEATTP